MRCLRPGIILLLTLSSALVSAAPLIGINIDVSGDSYHGRLALGTQYVDAITSAGGIPVILPPTLDNNAVDRYVQLCDGFLFTGGRDISPARYGSDVVHPTANLLNPRREDFDFTMIKAVLASEKPVLGVCLGSQEINVALGGSMIQDLPTETSSTISHKPHPYKREAHDVNIITGTRLQDIVGTTTLNVNSIHHQACDRLGSGILVMARAPDGIVESYEVQNHDFAMAVQWHPELLTTAPQQLAIYKALVNAAEKKAKSEPSN